MGTVTVARVITESNDELMIVGCVVTSFIELEVKKLKTETKLS